MNFHLSQEQELLQETLRQFIRNECPPTRVHQLFDAEQAHDPALWRGFCEMGLAAVALPERYGGAGLELLDLALVAEVLGEGAVPGPFLGHALGSLALDRAGSEAQKERWLPSLCSGETIASVALAEGEERWQPEDWQLEAAPSRGALRLTGCKLYVPFADVADIFVVGTAGGALALVSSGEAGVEIKQSASVDRTRRLGELILHDAPAELLPAGRAAAPRIRDAGLALLAADALGGAWRCVELAVAHAQTREQFGTTIGHFQALKHQLANMAVAVEPARALYWHAAHAFDHMRDEAPRACAIAKAHLGDCYAEVARDAVEALGGIGFTWEGDVQLYLKRALFDRAFLGSPAQQRARSAALGGW